MKTSDLAKWTLVGPGAVGLYYSAHIAYSGRDLCVLARSDATELEANGIRVEMIDPETSELKERFTAPIECVRRDANQIGVTDCVIIAAKSTVNLEIIESLKSIVEPRRTVLLCLQNGLGNAEFFAEHFPENPILTGLCFVCVNRTNPGLVENYHPGRVEIGSLGDRWSRVAKTVVEIFNHAGVLTSHAEKLDSALWRKLCWNIPFNGLAIAGGGITTDLILADPILTQCARDLMFEVQAGAKAYHIEIENSFLDRQFELTEPMGPYKPSSLIDFLDGKPVEIDAIWGEALRRGEAKGVAMPELEKLNQQLREAVG